jgi:hypothetical protein
MAVATKAEIEKVVHRVLEEQGDANGATLAAIKRVSRLLTEQVIPKLAPDAGDEGDGEDAVTVAAAPHAAGGRSQPDAEDHQDGDAPEGEETDVAAGEVPPSVADAFEAVYRSLSRDQAEAMADLFTAIGNNVDEGVEDGDEGLEDGEDGIEPDPENHAPSMRRRRAQRG